MAKRFIFTTGTSLLTNFINKYRNQPDVLEYDFESRFPKNDGLLRLSPNKWNKFRDFPNKELGVSVIGQGIALFFLEKWSRIHAKDEFQTAEIDSLSLLGETYNAAEDEIVLLSSDTSEGLFCALINAHLMSVPDQSVIVWEEILQAYQRISPIKWDSELEQPVRPIDNPCQTPVKVFVIKSLNPKQKAVFEKHALANLVRGVSELIFNTLDNHNQPHVVFTGGYKSTLPYLSLVCSWIGNVNMWGLFEDSKEILQIPMPKVEVEADIHRIIAGALSRSEQYQGFDQNFLKFKYMANFHKVSELEYKFQPFFSNSTNPERLVELSPLGIAFAEVILARMRSKKSRYEQISILKGE